MRVIDVTIGNEGQIKNVDFVAWIFNEILNVHGWSVKLLTGRKSSPTTQIHRQLVGTRWLRTESYAELLTL